MSWSMIEPEDHPVCECTYDETRDEMDREDCAFHCDLVDEVSKQDAHPAPRKKPDSTAANRQEGAA